MRKIIRRIKWLEKARLGAFVKILENRMAILGIIILLAFAFSAVFADFISPYDPLHIDLEKMLEKPSTKHILGTDELGRDILSRIIYGTRISLMIGVISVIIGLLFGVPLGAVAGYCGGKIDNIFMGITDVLLSFPSLLLAIAIVAVLGTSLVNAMIAIGISQIPVFARLVRGSVLSLKGREFVEAAKGVGATNFRIIFSHILPNCLAPIIVQSTLLIASGIIAGAGLGFLGLGAQPPTPEWGAMLSRGRIYIRVAPHICFFPGLTIMLAVLGFNLLGDVLRDVLDPRLRMLKARI